MPRQPRFGIGDKVRVAGEDHVGTIIEAGQPSGSTVYYLVHVQGDEEGAYYPEEDLTLIRPAGDTPAAWLLEQQLAEAGPFAEFFTIRKLRTRLSDHLYSYLASRTIFRIYQFKPVLKLLSSPVQRLLIADEVGLGKTIEAGLIWNELDARTRSQLELRNDVQRYENLSFAFEPMKAVSAEPVLLVDDLVYSGWTFAVTSMTLRKQAKVTVVVPFAVARLLEGSRTPALAGSG